MRNKERWCTPMRRKEHHHPTMKEHHLIPNPMRTSLWKPLTRWMRMKRTKKKMKMRKKRTVGPRNNSLLVPNQSAKAKQIAPREEPTSLRLRLHPSLHLFRTSRTATPPRSPPAPLLPPHSASAPLRPPPPRPPQRAPPPASARPPPGAWSGPRPAHGPAPCAARGPSTTWTLPRGPAPGGP